MRVRLLALALLAGAALAAQAAPARAAATGPLAVHVEGSLGAPTLEQPPLTVWPFRAVVTLRGVVDGSSDIDGTLVAFETGDPDRPLQLGSVWSGEVDMGGQSEGVTFVCVVTEFGARGEPLGGPCAVTGALTGRGAFQISELDLVPGAALAWTLDFPRVVCRRCA